MKVIKISLILTLLLITILSAGEIPLSIYFDRSKLHFSSRDGYELVLYDGLSANSEIGAPYLPVKKIQVAIPSDAVYDGIEIIASSPISLGTGHKIFPVQKPVPISFPVKQEFTEPSPEIYTKNTFYPASPIVHVHSGNMSGFRIESFLVYPVAYNPVTGELKFYSSIQFKVKYKEGVRSAKFMKRKQVETVKKAVKKLVINPQDVEIFSPPVR